MFLLEFHSKVVGGSDVIEACVIKAQSVLYFANHLYIHILGMKKQVSFVKKVILHFCFHFIKCKFMTLCFAPSANKNENKD